jgi:hypothetical protein
MSAKVQEADQFRWPLLAHSVILRRCSRYVGFGAKQTLNTLHQNWL